MIETIHLQLLLATFAGWVGRRQTAVITYLVEENRILKEQLESGGRRLRFTDDQRRRLAAKGKPVVFENSIALQGNHLLHVLIHRRHSSRLSSNTTQPSSA